MKSLYESLDEAPVIKLLHVGELLGAMYSEKKI